MTARTRLGFLLGASALGLVLIGGAPQALRHVDSFRVRRVEVRGTHYLAPHQVLQASGITRSANVFDSPTSWRTALEQHPLIARARIQRLLPSTIRVLIEEAEPLALLVGGSAGGNVVSMRPVTVEGEVLPLDPTTVDLDLPVVSVPAPGPLPAPPARIADVRVLAVLRLLVQMRRAEPTLFGWISDAEPVRNDVRIRLRAPAGAEVLLPDTPDDLQLRRLRLTLSDLTARQDINRLLRIDARYPDQIVVALSPTEAN
ncbi:MAG: cell division protein FtsQ/DivIB [Longimicrobiales bacterium]